MKKGFIIVITALLIAGCGSTTPNGSQEFATSNELANAQKYEEAIAYLQQAIAKSPKNKEYSERLTQFKTNYLSQTAAEVQNLLSQDLKKSNLDDIERKLAGLRNVGVQSTGIAEMQNQVDEVSSVFYEELEKRYKSAKSLMDQQDWVSAYAQLNHISSRFENYEDVTLRKNTIESQALKTYVRAANDALKEDNFDIAQSAIDKLLLILPNNPIAANLQRKLQNIDRPKHFLSKANRAFNAQDWKTVIESCERAQQYSSDTETCDDLIPSAKSKLTTETSQKIDTTIKEGRLFEAAKLYRQLVEMEGKSAPELVQLKSRLTDNINESAQFYKNSGNYAITWHLLKLNESIDPYFPNLSSELRTIEDEVSVRSRRSIAVFDFNSPPDATNSGVIVANNLISRLFNNASSDIRIIERDSLISILDEMKLGQTSVVSERAAKEMGQNYGIDYAIIGSVLLYKVDESTSISSKNVKYKIGEQIQDNIEYLNWKATNPSPTKIELQAAPKAKIMVAEYGQKDYEVIQTKKVGFIQLSFRIVDVITGENTRVETIERKMQVTDTANAGIGEAGIKFDEMEIATDTEIMQQLTDQIIDNMASEILKPLQQLEAYYLNEGTDKERRQENESAVQYYTYAIFNEKLKSVSSSPVTNAANNKITNLLANYRFKSRK